MVNECKNCEFRGTETKKTDGSVEDCKRMCVEDPGCIGINVGNSNNKCYFVHSVNAGTEAASSYQAWKKSTDCAGIGIYHISLRF